MKLNSYQKEALLSYRNTNQSVAIEALAGTGKTTFIVGTSKVLKYPKQAIFLTYTRTSKADLEERLQGFESQIKTTYSLGYTALLKEFGNLTVDDKKIEKQLKQYHYKIALYLNSLLGVNYDKRIFSALEKEICNLYDLALCYLYTEQDQIQTLSETILTVLSDDPQIHQLKSEIVANLIAHNLEKSPTHISYSEMIALPCLFNLKGQKVQEMLIDEAQDLSTAQQHLVKQTTFDNSQVIIVGDRNQAIFSFAGSDIYSFDNLCHSFNSKRHTMPINYRCGTEIIAYANKIKGGLLSPPNMHKGLVKELTQTEAFKHLMTTDKETMVISRTFKELLLMGLKLLYEDKQFYFVKGALEEKLNSTIGYYKTKCSFSSLRNTLKLDIKQSQDKNEIHRYTLLETLYYFLTKTKANTWTELKRKITYFFLYSQNHGSIKLSTIHSAKGLEAHTVIHLGSDLIPHFLCTTEEQLLSESNLEYVARTRAKHRYYYVR